MSKELEVFHSYTKGLEKGDFAAVFETMSDDIVWHMGGNSPLSGDVVGKQALGERLEEFAKRSNNTFGVVTNSVAQRSKEDKLNMPGIDLFRMEDGKICEVWTFAKNQAVEDEYWK